MIFFNLLGLTMNEMNRRKKQNILTLKGNFAAFAIETVTSIILMILIQDTQIASGPSLIVPLFFIYSPLMTIAFFILSPELRRFYFNKTIFK